MECQFETRGDRIVCKMCHASYDAKKVPITTKRECDYLVQDRIAYCLVCRRCAGAMPNNKYACKDREWRKKVRTGNCPLLRKVGLG